MKIAIEDWSIKDLWWLAVLLLPGGFIVAALWYVYNNKIIIREKLRFKKR